MIKNMKKIMLSLIFSLCIIFHTWVYAESIDNLNIWGNTPTGTHLNKNNVLQEVWNNDNFLKATYGWETSIKNSLVRIAFDLKNLFFILATVFFFVIVFKLILSDKTEEAIENFKKWVIWISLWLIIMQLWYVTTKILYDENISGWLANNLLEWLIYPIIGALEALVSFFFIAIAFYAFFRLVTAGWDDEKVKWAKMSVVQAIIWFIIIKIAKLLLETTYGVINCKEIAWGFIEFSEQQCLDKAELSSFPSIIVTLINWANGFIWIITILLILYAGFLVLTSAWDEEKLKKVKSILLYIAIWIFVLFASYLILTFFILPETTI